MAPCGESPIELSCYKSGLYGLPTFSPKRSLNDQNINRSFCVLSKRWFSLLHFYPFFAVAHRLFISPFNSHDVGYKHTISILRINLLRGDSSQEESGLTSRCFSSPTLNAFSSNIVYMRGKLGHFSGKCVNHTGEHFCAQKQNIMETVERLSECCDSCKHDSRIQTCW